MNTIYITGDTHGKFNRISDFCNENKTLKDDVMIILGDVGLNYYGDVKDYITKEKVSRIPMTFLCLRGNHEMRPSGETVRIENALYRGDFIVENGYPSILWMLDGNTYELNVNGTWKKALVIGGAYSVDKYFRLAMKREGATGYNWFPDEQLSKEEMSEIFKAVKDNTFDYVLTHTCPMTVEPRDMFLSGIDQDTVDTSTEDFLQTVSENIKFKDWYCGHWHTDRDVKKYHFMFNNITKLK